MENLYVSIIVPVYDVEKYLQQCIDSICSQTYPYIEIILVDDGSPDLCGKICDQNAFRDSRIRVIHKENGGLSSARNAGLEIARGKYVAFVDADDTIHVKYIEILINLCQQYDCQIAQCDFLAISEASVKLPLNSQGLLTFYTGKQAVSQLCMGADDVKYSVAWNKLYERRLFDEIRYPMGRIHEDEFTTYRILWEADRVVVTNQYLYYYLQRPESIMGRKFSVKRLDSHAAFRERLDFLKENRLEKEYTATLRKYINLIERDYRLLKESVEEYEDICLDLLREKESLEWEFLPALPQKENLFQVEWTTESCPFGRETSLVLYGAGKWGWTYYEWIHENHWGKIVGWVDNFWYLKVQKAYSILPLDSLITNTYDCVLLAIKSKTVQAEVVSNLKSWGIPETKIVTI